MGKSLEETVVAHDSEQEGKHERAPRLQLPRALATLLPVLISFGGIRGVMRRGLAELACKVTALTDPALKMQPPVLCH